MFLASVAFLGFCFLDVTREQDFQATMMKRETKRADAIAVMTLDIMAVWLMLLGLDWGEINVVALPVDSVSHVQADGRGGFVLDVVTGASEHVSQIKQAWSKTLSSVHRSEEAGE